MLKGFFNVPKPVNEPVKSYAPGSPERIELQQTLKEFRSQVVDVPMYIGSEEVRTDNKKSISPPHDHKHLLGLLP
jgi:1-pyrroline-5-carboxylate dehydrogenase